MSTQRTLSYTAAGIIACACATAALAENTIYECRDAEGRPHFTDTGCPNRSVGVEVQTGPVRVIPFTRIDAEEEKRLATLAADWRKRAQQQRVLKQRAQQSWARRASERKARCATARKSLDALAAARRQGYSLQEARRLDDQEADLKREIRSACG